jgi:hypothetical protein
MKRVVEKARELHLHLYIIVTTFLVALPLAFQRRVSRLSFFLSFDASSTAIFPVPLNRIRLKKYGPQINQQVL